MPFQSVRVGNYYLTDASGFRNAGTNVNISVALLADLAKRTTYPPLLISQTTFSSDQTLSAVSKRDTDAPDLGYHYDAVDYLVTALTVDHARLALGTGVVALVYGDSGFTLNDGATLSSSGTPFVRNHISRYNTVQEQPIILANGSVVNNKSIVPNTTGASPPLLECHFTDFEGFPGQGYHI